MNELQTENGAGLEEDVLDQATVRELIVQLALTEEEHRNAANPGHITVLAKREQAIVAALRTSEPTQMFGES